MAACIHVKVQNSDESAQIQLLCAKTKVAPLKPVTIPRLQLTAAWMLLKLVKHAQEVLELAQAPIYLWTDSSVALTWILSHPSKWKEFVRNRVSSSQELNPTTKWLYIPGKHNPADFASRGLTPTQLTDFKLWWKGPEWLKGSFSSWPAKQFKPSALAHKEERSGVLLHAAKAPSEEDHPLWSLLSRYSLLSKLSRITALCLRFVALLRGKTTSSLVHNPIAPQEQLDAKLIWVKIIQRLHFPFELKTLRDGLQLPSSHFVSKLAAFADQEGIRRVGGRLINSELEEDEIHPIILPGKSYFSQLVIDQAHRRTLHGGTQVTFIHVREKFWILEGRAPIRSFILRCVICARRAQQLMGQLPADRVVPVRPFHTTRVDYAGPFTLKTFQGRGAKTYKGWTAVFVCFETSAVHLELVSDYSTET
ncbi:uncharacterized protein [Chelonus insularis]|uniref:uncharacterized protein n=1 Tax=Chelonus insularis TaxID=460826 RepID=UPI00158E6CFD|nr:uncharacterized protein LOC118071402 [Chelonus insularis]